MNRRVLVASLGVAAVISVLGGWALSRSDTDGVAPEDDITLGTPGVVQIPSIETNAVVAGTQLPDVELEDNDGNAVSTADLIGRPMVINYWYSTCAPCKKELPDFAAVHADLGDQVRFVGVNPYDTAEVNESFARDRGVQYELLRDPSDSYGSTIGVATAPFTLFVRADGSIARQTGVLDEATLRRYTEELLG